MNNPALVLANVVLLIANCCTAHNNGVSVIRSTTGQTDVKLSCPTLHNTSPGPDNRLMFTSVLWFPENKPTTVIGAGAEYNHKKFQYLASTGQLLFKETLNQDHEGIYRCIVRNGSRISSSAVQLLVKHLYAHRWEEEFWGNLTRSSIAGGLALATIMSACLVYTCRHQSKPTPGSGGRGGGPRSGHYSISSRNSPSGVETVVSGQKNANSTRQTSNTTSFNQTPSGSLAKNTPPSRGKIVPGSGLGITTSPSSEPLSISHLSNNHRKLSNTSNSRSETGISMKSISNNATVINENNPVPPSSELTSSNLISVGVNTTLNTPVDIEQGGESGGGAVKKPKPGPTIIYITASED